MRVTTDEHDFGSFPLGRFGIRGSATGDCLTLVIIDRVGDETIAYLQVFAPPAAPPASRPERTQGQTWRPNE